MKNRLLKGYEYFISKKPSTWTVSDTVWLHKWLEMLKNSAGGKLSDESLQTVAQMIFGKAK